jgi:UDP-N-acetylmuramyl pentapeptide synthase
VTAISTDTATINRPDTTLITTNPYSYLSALGERTRIMTAKHDSLTSL